MSGVSKKALYLTHRTVPLRCLRVVVLAGLVILLMAGCRENATSENGDRAAVDKSGETSKAEGQKRTDSTSVEENGGTSDPTVETLGLLTRLIETSDVVLRKLAGEQEAYASAGDAQGERLMVQATVDARNTRRTSSSLKRDIQAVDNGTSQYDNGTSQYDEPADQLHMPSSELAQLKVQAIEESTDQLEKNLAEAKQCCELPPDFLNEELRELRAQTNSIEALIKHIEFEQPPTQPTTQPTAESTEQQ